MVMYHTGPTSFVWPERLQAADFSLKYLRSKGYKIEHWHSLYLPLHNSLTYFKTAKGGERKRTLQGVSSNYFKS